MNSVTFLRWPLMGYLILLGSVLASETRVHPLIGDYQVNLEQAHPLTSYEVEGVWTINEAGRERYQELRSLGAQCSHQGRGLMRCQRFLNDQQLPENIQHRLERRFLHASFSFEPASRIELLTKGEDIEEYLVHQGGVVQEAQDIQTFDQWRYFFSATGLEKIQAGVRNPTPYGLVRTPAGIELVFQQSITLGRDHFQVWLVALPFTKHE